MPIPATIEELETKILELPERDRARLMDSLMRSLTPADDEVMAVWLDEAEHRDRELDEDLDAAVSAQEALQKARAGLG